jgi:hypothetical protein
MDSSGIPLRTLEMKMLKNCPLGSTMELVDTGTIEPLTWVHKNEEGLV